MMRSTCGLRLVASPEADLIVDEIDADAAFGTLVARMTSRRCTRTLAAVRAWEADEAASFSRRRQWRSYAKASPRVTIGVKRPSHR